MNDYVKILKKLNKKAEKNGDVPVSCLILKDDTIISKGYNKREKDNNPLYHSEIIAIVKATKKLKTWNLSECKLIVTLKPCNMCMEVIKASKIRDVYYILDNEKVVNSKINLIKVECKDNEYFSKELKKFFHNKR